MKAPEKIYIHLFDGDIFPDMSEDFSRCQLYKSDVEYTRSDLCMVWQPIADAPRDGTEVLVQFANGQRLVCWWHAPKNILPHDYNPSPAGWLTRIFTTNYVCGNNATHFMLIKPPEGL